MKFSTELFPVLLVMTSILLTPSEAIGQKRRPSPPFQSLCNTKGPKACIHFGKCQLADCSKSNNCDKCRQVCLGKKILMTKTSFVSKMKTSGAFNYPFCSLKAPIDVKNFQSWYWQTRRLRWLDTVFQGQYLPSLSVNYVAINKNLEKLAPQLY